MSHSIDQHVGLGAMALPEGREFPTLREEWLSRAFRARIPLSVTLELTRRCNLTCLHCYLCSSASHELSADRWEGVVEELAAAGTASVALTGGEVSLKRGWLRIAEAVRRSGMMLVVLTNGTRLSESDLDRLAELRPVRVGVSLYDTDPTEHDRVTGTPGSHRNALRTLEGLVERDVPCRVSGVLLHGLGAGAVRRVKSLAEALGCDFGCSPLVYPGFDGSREPLKMQADPHEYRQMLLDGASDLFVEYMQLVRSGGEGVRRPVTNCRAGIMGAFVQADGDVLPCMGWPPPFGNVTEMSFADAWMSDEAHAHRERMTRPLTGCDSCGISGLCLLRCPKLAEIETGSMFGECPSACMATRVAADLADPARGDWAHNRIVAKSEGVV